ncbi:TIM barrel protein [bacterium]|jgi:L-ribulose-5-phosphate 3-epimerase|nr:TIM barrel protein [bacterium]
MSESHKKIGFIQGRLVDPIDGKIQAFPWGLWQEELVSASKLGLDVVEWTLDYDGWTENPLMTKEGQERINFLKRKLKISIPALTADCFMQFPYYKDEKSFDEGCNLLKQVINACFLTGIKVIVFPLVDKGSLKHRDEVNRLLKSFEKVSQVLNKTDIKIAFESDFNPIKLKKFIDLWPVARFGINYDMGNSAALGFHEEEEVSIYGPRIIHVHVKDRLYGGTTVPFGTGDTNIRRIIKLLVESGYTNYYILQSARDKNGYHEEIILEYKKIVSSYIKKALVL